MNLHDYDFSNIRMATVLATERLTPREDPVEVKHLVLAVPEDDRLDYVEGQSIAVLVPGPHDFGKPYHFRLYSIASPRHGENGQPETFSICVRRCFYIDEVSGERYPGLASNYLCNAEEGDPIQIAGPYGSRFSVPDDPAANLVMIGVGTGIAPFRAFVKHIYEERGGWQGQVRLFYGAKTGMELLYMNDVRKDLSLYYDEKSFKAFEALSPRPHFDEPPDLERVLSENSKDVWNLIRQPNTYIFIAGLSDVARNFRKAMIPAAGSTEAWDAVFSQLMNAGRYSELLYE
jgi:ferredoxin--NADP+ reductase